MGKIISIILLTFTSYLGSLYAHAEDSLRANENELNLFTGMFDFSDGKQSAGVLGLQHQNENLFRNSKLGKLSPITGGFITGKNSMYFYTGVEANYGIGPIKLKPSFTPGYYEAGDGKDLGAALEFKSEIKVDFEIFENSKLGYTYSHISNNDWGSKNPGTDNQSITFSQKF